MSNQFLQIEKWIRILCGYVIFPCLLITALFKAGISEYNFSGLLNKDGWRSTMMTASLIMLVWCIRTLLLCSRKEIVHQKKVSFWLCLFSISTMGAVFTPYVASELSATIHLFFSYTAVIFFNIVLYFLFQRNSSARNIYLAVTFFCVLLCFTKGEISGAAELIYACMVSVLLTYLSN
jgi:hypothetical protein